jgi:cytochrome b561
VNSVHGFTADLILYLFIIHVAAALYHQFVKRDGLIWRMVPVDPGRLNAASADRATIHRKED